MPTWSHDPTMAETAPHTPARQFWEGFYHDRDQVWTGKPNELLVREVDSMTPGTALDLGCGEGADAIWLAEHGWLVTATDVSTTALRRAAARAVDVGLAARIDWQHHDLSQTFPTGVFDLVSAQYLHSPVAPAGERETILCRAARVVAPGGVLLIAGHAGGPSWHHQASIDVHFPTTAEVVDSLGLQSGQWQVELDEIITCDLTGPDGQPGFRTDNLLRIRRQAAEPTTT
jgi:SAM-dependent methyltransferase